MSRILCAVDDSAHARTAARVAARLATRLELDVVLTHAVAAKPPGVGCAVPTRSGLPNRGVRRDAARAARRLLIDVAHDIGLPDCRRRIEIGPASDCIIRAAAALRPALLVIGSRGRRGVRRALLGSVSLAVARGARCPVVIVPPAFVEHASACDQRRPADGTVLCGVARRDDSHVVTAAWLAHGLSDRLVLAHVLAASSLYPGARASTSVVAHALQQRVGLERLQCALDRLAMSGYAPKRCALRLHSGDPAAQLARIAREEEAELVVIERTRRMRLRDGLEVRLVADGHTPVVVASVHRAADPTHRPTGRARGTVNGSGMRSRQRLGHTEPLS